MVEQDKLDQDLVS